MPKKNKKPNKKKHFAQSIEIDNNNNIININESIDLFQQKFINNCNENNHLNCAHNLNLLLEDALKSNKCKKILSNDTMMKKIIQHIDKKIYSIPFLINYIQFKKFCFENFYETSKDTFKDNLSNLFNEVEENFNNLKKNYNELQNCINKNKNFPKKKESFPKKKESFPKNEEEEFKRFYKKEIKKENEEKNEENEEENEEKEEKEENEEENEEEDEYEENDYKMNLFL